MLLKDQTLLTVKGKGYLFAKTQIYIHIVFVISQIFLSFRKQLVPKESDSQKLIISKIKKKCLNTRVAFLSCRKKHIKEIYLLNLSFRYDRLSLFSFIA